MSIYEEDNEYIDGEERKPKLFIVLGFIFLIAIILFIIVSCSIKTNKKSNNNYLSSLRVSNAKMTPEFSKDITNYTVETELDVVSIYCTSESSKATTEGCNKQLDISKIDKVQVIKVKAEDKTVREYTLNFKKQTEVVNEDISVTITSSVKSEEEVNDSIILQSVVTPSDLTVKYEWYKDNEKIENETLSYYKATESGNYYVKITDTVSDEYASSDIFVVNITKSNKNSDSTNNSNKSNNSSSNNNNTSSVVKINSITGNSDSWVSSVTLKVNAEATKGLATQPYSFDGGKTYQSSNSKTFTKNQTVTVVVKDKNGKTTSKTVNITKIDNTTPSVSINANSKTNTSVVLNANVNPSSTSSGYKYEWYKNGNPIQGANKSSYTATSTGKYKVKVTTGSNITVYSSEYSFTVVTVTCPTLSAETLSGKNVLPNTWYGEYIYVKIVPSSETVSYDVYLNKDGEYNSISKEFTYFNTFNSSVKVRVVNGGMRVLKIVVKDKKGNYNECYSHAYYLR